MCGRFYVPADDAELFAMIAEANRKAPSVPIHTGEIRPGDFAAVLARSRTGKLSAFPMHWGYRLTDGRLVFNARSETAAVKPMFRDGMQQRRCLIPASGYYEWDHSQPRPPKMYFTRTDNRHLLLAGIYRPENDRSASFTILTRQPTEQLSVFHDRMPVILSEDLQQSWLEGSPADLVISKAVTQLQWQIS